MRKITAADTLYEFSSICVKAHIRKRYFKQGLVSFGLLVRVSDWNQLG